MPEPTSIVPAAAPVGTEAAEDLRWMRRALACARRAVQVGEVPVGALVLLNGRCLGEGWNRSITTCDPSAHAEILALRAAARSLDNHRLPGAVLYVTLEPCLMCAGAVMEARVARLVYGAADTRAGAAGSAHDLFSDAGPAGPVVRGGVLAEPCAALLQEFFHARR